MGCVVIICLHTDVEAWLSLLHNTGPCRVDVHNDPIVAVDSAFVLIVVVDQVKWCFWFHRG